jgi:hypothetical protein
MCNCTLCSNHPNKPKEIVSSEIPSFSGLFLWTTKST